MKLVGCHVQNIEKIFDISWYTGVFVGHLFEIFKMSEGPFSHDAGHIKIYQLEKSNSLLVNNFVSFMNI